jgi:hypothetical protein
MIRHNAIQEISTTSQVSNTVDLQFILDIQ